MSKLTLMFFLFCISSVLFGQRRLVKEGDYHFKHFRYYEAALSYKEAFEISNTDYDVAYKLAESYMKYFNYSNSENYYRIVVENDIKKYPMAQFWYAETRKLRGDYKGAKIQFNKLLSDTDLLRSLDKGYAEKAELELLGCEMAINELKKPARDYKFHLLDGSINSEGSEYAPEIYLNDSSIIITSNNANITGQTNNHYKYEKDGPSWTEVGFDDEDDFYKIVNTKYNEAVGSFTSDKQKYYFTRCDGKQKHSEFKEFNCLIYLTEKNDGKWQKATPLNKEVNKEGQWTANPSISPNADTLFFVSKRSGGQGMHDIWYSTCNGNDKWTAAKNLESVNTPFIDIAPKYSSDDHALYFSSNGRESFGGLDIYIAKGDDFEDIHNMGMPFNSNKDDFGFVLGDELGYLSSNREEGKGNDDIYSFNKKSKEAVVVEISQDSLSELSSVSITGTVLSSETHEPLSNVKETLVNRQGEEIKTTRTNEKGEFRFDNLTADQSYKILIEDGENTSIINPSKVILENVEVKGSTELATEIQFENIYFDFNRSVLRPEAVKVLERLVEYYHDNINIQVEINANTDNIGSLDDNVKLSKKRGNSAYWYLTTHGIDKSAIVINAKGESDELASNTSKIGRQLNRRVEFTIIGGGKYSPEGMTYIIGTTTSLQQVAEQFNMTIDELKDMNNMDSEDVYAFRPLRVRNIGDDDLVAPLTLANASKKNKKYYKKQSQRYINYQKEYDELNVTYSNYKVITEELKLKPEEDYYVALFQNTLWRISKLYGMTVKELRDVNNLFSNRIFIE